MEGAIDVKQSIMFMEKTYRANKELTTVGVWSGCSMTSKLDVSYT